MAEITATQKRFLQKIRSYTAEHGIPPTIQELAERLDIKGSSVYEQVQRLKAKGMLLHEPGKARSLRVVNDGPDSPPAEDVCRVAEIFSAQDSEGQAIPLFSSMVPAGFPSPADDYIENQLDLNQYLINHPAATFFVRVSGTSMTGAGINHGSILVVDRSLEPNDGDIVVAVIHGELTVKRLKRYQGGRVFLVPENPDYKPVELTQEMEVTIWGVVTSAVQEFRKP
ncbi:MAG: repressor LexA [Magnetococcales bacterium]|nr:repressor LexA [Magnetococcales bacterium]